MSSPVKFCVWCIWQINDRVSRSLLPGNIFLPWVKISASTQPTAQTSTPKEYAESSSRTSGALYHLVTTLGVSCWCYLCVCMIRARPKSHNLTTPDGEMRMLADFMSLCKTLFSSRWAKPSKTYLIKQPTYRVLYLGFKLMIPKRSYGTYSKTKLTVCFRRENFVSFALGSID